MEKQMEVENVESLGHTSIFSAAPGASLAYFLASLLLGQNFLMQNLLAFQLER